MSRPLEEVQDEIFDRLHAGEAVDREAILAEHAEHEEALTAVFDVIDIVERTTEGIGLVLARRGEYRFVREIRRGSMGRTYEAEQIGPWRRVALKVLTPTLRLDAGLVSRFRHDAEVAGRLRHAGIVPVLSVGEAAGTPYFAMELVDGVSLRQVLEKRRAGEDAGLPEDPEAWRRWAVKTTAEVAVALAHAHENHVLHRAVRPGNVLVGEDGVPRLTGFGLALDLRAPEITHSGEALGSPQYMSPEQARGGDAVIDERTDVYSLAVTLYELLTLRLPYEGTTHEELLTALLAGEVVPPRRVDPSIPHALEQVLMGALHEDPRERYQGAAAFAHDLRAALGGEAPTRLPLVPMSGTKRALLALGGLLVLVVLAVALWPDGEGGKDGEGGLLRVDAKGVVAPRESLLDVYEDYEARRPETREEFQGFIRRLLVHDPDHARETLERVYADYVRGPGSDDLEARLFLGYREFSHAVPETIRFRGHPYVRAVEAAARKRWFGPEEEGGWGLAQRAWEETLRHAQKLADSPRFRAEVQVLAGIAKDGDLRRYHVTSRWAGPYLLCHLGTGSSSDFGLLVLPAGRARDQRSAEMSVRRMEIDRLLEDTARYFTALHEAYWLRFGRLAKLRPLMGAWGGRTDLGESERNFPDGVPLVVLLFDDSDAWDQCVETLRSNGSALPRTARGGFSARSTYLYAYREDADDVRSLALQPWGALSEGVHQLQYWFRRQRKAWWVPPTTFTQNWFEEGLAEYLASVRLEPDGTLAYGGVSRSQLQGMQTLWRTLQRQGKEYPIFTLRALVGFESFAEVVQWARENVPRSGGVILDLYYQQAWALTYFLNHGEDGRYRERYEGLFDLLLQSRSEKGDLLTAFKGAFGVASDEDWAAMDEAFQTYVRDHLMKRAVPK